jgi:AcrR family transcriptional regulator
MPEADAQVTMIAPKGSADPGGSPVDRGAATRSRLLEAAAQLIAERGWGEVTTRLVAERAGVNQALVHYHFGSMDVLLREAAMARMAPELADAVGPLTRSGPLPAALREAVASLERFEPGSRSAVLMAEVLLRSTRDPVLADRMGVEIQAFRSALERRLEGAAASGEVRTDVPPRVLATIVGATLDGLLLQRMAEADVDPEDVAGGLHRLLTRKE